MAEARQQPAGGLSVQTLLVSSLAAVVATVVVSQFWEQGTLLFTAMVPIVVAVTSELLRRPAERITAVAPKVAPIVVPRRAPDGTEVREPAPEPARERDDPFGLREPEKRPLLDDRRVRLGLVTGLVAFVLGAAFVTLSELTLGGSVGGGERRTTLLGGSSSGSSDGEEEEATPSATPAPADPGATSTPIPQATPEPQATPSPAPTTTPTPTPTTSPTPATPEPSPVP